jgi:hypothetical protein
MKRKNPSIHSMLEHLAERARNPETIDLWPELQARAAEKSRRAPAGSRRGFSLRIALPALAAVLALVVTTIWLAGSATPVSAQQILDRAAAAQSQAATSAATAVTYRKVLVTNYPHALEGDTITATHTIRENYYDFAKGLVRWDSVDADTGMVLDAFSFDGLYTYDAIQTEGRYVDGVLLVYRAIEDESGLLKVVQGSGTTAEQIFEMQRNAPNVTIESHETWSDGREVYVLSGGSRSPKPAEKLIPDGTVEQMVFDAKTYQLIETRQVAVRDGKEILLSASRTLVDEVLASSSQVPWDLHDLQNIRIADKPTEEPTATP